jgi:hypothetical protein
VSKKCQECEDFRPTRGDSFMARLRFWLKNRKFKKNNPGLIYWAPKESRDILDPSDFKWPEGRVSLGYTDDTGFPHGD